MGRIGTIGPGSFYDPISPGTSRRSSQMSTASSRINPAVHLQGPYSTSNLVVQTQNMSLQGPQGITSDWMSTSHFQQPSADRRMSEPARQLGQRVSPPMPPRPRSAQLPELHPNQEVILDEVGEGEMVENKLVMPDEFLQYLNQVQAGGNQVSYRGSPLPNCRSPICTNPLHCQRQQQTCNYNQQHQISRCYMSQQSNQQENCSDYGNTSSYNQCQNSRIAQQSYCPTQNFPSQNCSSQIASPGSVQVMSPGSHYSASHISDQPINSPAAGALPPQQAQQNLQNNTAQLSRNCIQNNDHAFYPSYCQGQSGVNCNNQQMNTQPCSPLHIQTPQSCSATHMAARPVSGARPCQPLSPHCPDQQLQIHRPIPGNMIHNQCAMSPTSDQCHQQMYISESHRHISKPTTSVQPMTVVEQCHRVGPVCSPSGLVNQKQSLNRDSLMTSIQSPQQMQTSPCPQILSNCPHPNRSNITVPTTNPAKEIRGCSENNCHVQFCSHGCHEQTNDPLRYNCTNECQWDYSADQCYHNQSGNTQEIQCRDISQSQQGSPMKPPQGMRQDSYRRTLEYVQQCRNWSGTAQVHEASVSSSTHPMSLPQPLPASANMIVNDMTSSLSSLLEENRYLQMIQ